MVSLLQTIQQSKYWVVALLAAVVLHAQTITITSPTNNAIVTSVGPDGRTPIMPITVSVASLPSLDHVEYYQDGVRLKYLGIIRSAPWSTVYYPGIEGDSTIGFYAVAKDVFGTVLATSSTVTVTTKYTGAVSGITNITPPLSGDVPFGYTLNHPYGSNNPGTLEQFFIDGRASMNTLPAPMNSWLSASVGALPSNPPYGATRTASTAQFRNGNHELISVLWQDSGAGAYAPNGTITVPAASINTSTGALTTLYHPIATAQQGNAITLTTSNVCPTGFTCDGATPYYGIYVDRDHFKLAASAGGAAVIPSTQGTGNLIVAYKITNNYWCRQSGDNPCTVPESGGGTYPLSYSRQIVDFENGAAAMEMRPLWQECFLTPGSFTDANGQPCSLAPTIMNTDGSTTVVAANIPTYTAQDDGAGTGCASVNTSTGLVTAAGSLPVSPCKMSFNVACASGACSGLPTVNVRINVATTQLMPHLSKGGAILTTYTPGSSLFARFDFHANNGAITTIPWAAQEYADVGYNVMYNSDGQGTLGPTNPSYTACTTPLAVWESTRAAYKSTYATYGFSSIIASSFLVLPPRNVKAFLTDLGFNRHACIQQMASEGQTDGMFTGYVGGDEVNTALTNHPNPQRVIGQREFTNIVVSGGTATFNGLLDSQVKAWNPATGGPASTVRFVGGTTPGLTAVVKAATSTLNGNAQTTSFTFSTTAADGTYTSSTDPTLELIYWGDFGGQYAGVCSIPGFTSSDRFQQGWSAQLTSVVVLSGVGTVHWTSHGFSTGQIVYTWLATSAGLYVADPITVIDANTFTVPMPSAANGTYNSSTDVNLYFTNDCMFDNHYWTDMQQGFFGSLYNAGSVTSMYPIIGTAYGFVFPVTNWNHDQAVQNARIIYTASVPDVSAYGYGISSYQVLFDHWVPFVTQRQQSLEPWIALTHHLDADMSTGCKSFGFDPSCSRPRILYGPPSTVLTRFMWPLSTGVVGHEGYYNASAPDGIYSQPSGTNDSAGISHYGKFSANQYVPIALSNNVIARLEKYYLQPRINTPYYGPMAFSTAHQSSYGRLLMVGSLSMMPVTEVIDFTAFKYAGGSITRYAVNPRTVIITPISASSTSNTYQFNTNDDAGEAVFYKFTASATDPDLTTLTIPAPTFPTGATKMAYKLNYYYRAVDEADAVDCTAGCSIVVDKSKPGATIKWLFLGSDNSVKYAGDAQRL